MLARDGAELPCRQLRVPLFTPSRTLSWLEITSCAFTRSEACAIDFLTEISIAKSILAYGDSLAPSTWQHAVYRWMEGNWQMLIDLTTENERMSDLTLHAKIYGAEPLILEIQSVHVP